MSLYAIADLHLSLGADKPMDIFAGWKDYEKKLKSNWCEKIKAEDTVVIAGDISWAMGLEGSYKDFEFIHDLPGKKLVLKGNHDYWWNTKTKVQEFFDAHGFNDISIIHNNSYVIDDIAVCGSRGWIFSSSSDEDKKILKRETGRIETSLKSAIESRKTPIVFLHYPPVYDGVVCPEIIEILKKYDVKDCYFGHVHGSAAIKKVMLKTYDGINLHLISADYLSFSPVLVK